MQKIPMQSEVAKSKPNTPKSNIANEGGPLQT